MSDMYLVLRSRLDDVQSWVNLGRDVMREAQQHTGLSDERVARQIPVSTRTWIRWRDRGQVPAAALDKVAIVLGLEVERPEPRRVRVEEEESELDRLEALEAAVAQGFEDMRATLEHLADAVAQSALPRRRAPAGKKKRAV
jgi:hypothetical protein